MELAMVNDRIVALGQLDPAYLNRGTFFGDGVYEVVRSYDGRIFAMREHMQRLAASLREIRMTGVSMDDIQRRVEAAFAQAGIANAVIYFHITRGSARRRHTWDKDLSPNFFLTITEVEDLSALKREGVKASTYPDLRWKRCDIKSLNLLPNVLAMQDAVEKGCFEAVLVDKRGRITEGAASAFFAVTGGRLVTRPLGHEILPSITRLFVIRLAAQVGLQVVERAITIRQAQKADELFLGATIEDVLPIVELDGKRIGDGRPGRHTRRLMEEFNRLVSR